VLSGILALTDSRSNETRLAVTTIVVGGVVLVFGLLVTVLASGAVRDPVVSVRTAMLDVEQGRLDREVVIFDGSEVGSLQAGFNQMAAGLRERAASALGEVELGGESRVASVLFVDLEGSTAYATEHDPAEVVAMLNRFFGVVVDEVDERGGLVNKFVGDAVLAVFGAPVELDDHAAAALGAARAIAARLAEELPELGVGVGVATGDVVAGNVGHEERYEYTVIGDAVNSAARLTDLAKQVDGRVLVAWDAVASATREEAARWREADATTLRGRSSPTRTAVPRD
jgi:adenylate cyclase